MKIINEFFQIDYWQNLEEAINTDLDFHLYYKDEKYFGTFITITALQNIMGRHAYSGESASGIYCLTNDMVILKEITKDNIEIAIMDIINTGSSLNDIFTEIK